jgi:mannosyltransferase
MLTQQMKDKFTGLVGKPWMPYVWLALITLFGAALRFYKLGAWSFWIDEIYTINRAQIHFSDPILVMQNLPTTLWLPVSVILTNVSLNVLGISEWSARLASVFIGITSMPILYLFARRIFGVGVALVLTLLLAFSPWHLFWSQNARFYTSLMLLYALASFLFYLGLERDRPVYFLGFYILFYFALSERLVAAFLMPVIFIYVFCLWIFRFKRPPGLHARNLLLFLAPILLMIAFEIIRYAMSGNSLTKYFIADFGEKQVEDPIRLFLSIIYNIGFSAVAMGTVAGVYLLMKRDRAGLFLLLSATVPIVLLVFMNPVAFTKDRYVFVTLTFWLILAALGIRELVSQTQGWGKLLALGALAVLLADSVGSNILYYHVNNGNRRDWHAAFEIVKQKSRSEDVVVAWWPEFSPYYLGREILPYKDVTVEEMLESGQRYWFVIDSETVWGNIPMRDWLEEHGQLMDILYLRLPEDDFNLKIYLYDPALDLPDE